MTQYVPIEINRDLVRDVSNRALLNTNLEELKTYYAERDLRLKELEQKQTMEQKVNKLEEDIMDIKNMLRDIVQMKAPNGN
jgi:predicted nuclease with TOPRIM domain